MHETETTAKPDLEVQCLGCMGSGVIRYMDIADKTCRGCFGTGRLSLAHQDEPAEDSVWDAARAMLDLVKVDTDPEAYAYRRRDDGEWIVISYETAKHRERAMDKKELEEIAETAIQIHHKIIGATQSLKNEREALAQLCTKLGDMVVEPAREEWKRETLKLYRGSVAQLDAIITILGTEV